MADNSNGGGFFDTPDFTSDFDQPDIDANKTMAMIGYLGILFLIPLLAAPNSKYAKFHANQGLVNMLFSMIPVVGILGFVNMIMGILNTSKGLAKEVPVWGKFRLIN